MSGLSEDEGPLMRDAVICNENGEEAGTRLVCGGRGALVPKRTRQVGKTARSKETQTVREERMMARREREPTTKKTSWASQQ